MKLPANCFPDPFLAHAKQHEKKNNQKINQNRTKKESEKPFKVAKIVLSSGDRALPPEWVDKVEGVQQAGELVR